MAKRTPIRTTAKKALQPNPRSRLCAVSTASLLTWALLSLPAVSSAVTTVACVGNSITEGRATAYASVGITITDGGYPTLLQRKLGSGYNVINYGLGGRWVTHTDSASKSVYENNDKCRQLLASKPDVVLYMLGANDCISDVWNNFGYRFARDFENLGKKLKALNPNGEFYVLKLLPVLQPSYNFLPNVNRDSIVPKIDSLCKLNNWRIVDTRTPFLAHPDYLSVDGVHPDQHGMELLAATVYTAVFDRSPVKQPFTPLIGSSTNQSIPRLFGHAVSPEAFNALGRKGLVGSTPGIYIVPAEPK